MPYLGVRPADITSATEAEVAGDLTVDTNTLKVDAANNRLGVGTASPSTKIHLNESGSANAVQRVQAGTNGYAAQVHLYGNNVGGSAYNAVKSFVNGDSTPQWEITGPEASAEDVMTLHTGGTERMRIDDSGRITMPSQPAFGISGNVNSFQDNSSNETTVFHGQSGSHATDLNIGSHFSYSNGRFTAPVAGQYFFSFTMTTNDSQSHYVEIRKNGSSIQTVLLYGLQYNSSCHSTILTLAQNDYVDARRRGTSYSVYGVTFAGFLIG